MTKSLAGPDGPIADREVSKLSGPFPYDRPMKRLLILTVLTAALLPGAAWAQGQSQGNAPDSPPGQENRPDDPPGLQDRDDPPPGMDNRPDTPPGLDDDPEPGSGASPSPSGGSAPAQGVAEEDRALEAVRTGRAVPLDRVLSKAQSATGGDLIDTRLLTVEGFLLYELRMLLPDGTVDRLYYYASTGNPVTTR